LNTCSPKITPANAPTLTATKSPAETLHSSITSCDAPAPNVDSILDTRSSHARRQLSTDWERRGLRSGEEPTRRRHDSPADGMSEFRVVLTGKALRTFLDPESIIK
jgi:hypothetical protein